MSALNSILSDTLQAQRRFFRLCESSGLSFKALHYDTGIPVATLQSWAKETAMPLAALNRFAKAGVPDELISILTEPGGKVICHDGPEGDLDALGVEAAGYVNEWAAVVAGGDTGADIRPEARERLSKRRTRLLAAAGVR
ncbi:MAG: hypothetical protein EBY30_04445 [Rhodospirillales bacterium]|nr:hypothetical protein [Rhodospirillales bacterium]